MPTVSHGYQDFNRVVSQSDVLFSSEFNTLLDTNTFRDLGYVGNQPFLGCLFGSVNGTFRVSLDFWAEAAHINELATYEFDVASAGSYIGAVPIGGPFATVTIVAFAAGSHFNMVTYSSPSEYVGALANVTDCVLFSEKARSVAAGADFTYNSTITYPGYAHLCIHTTAAAWNATLSGVQYSGLLTHINFIENAGANWNETPFLPPMPIRLVVHNSDAASKFFDISLIARPWSPGR